MKSVIKELPSNLRIADKKKKKVYSGQELKAHAEELGWAGPLHL